MMITTFSINPTTTNDGDIDFSTKKEKALMKRHAKSSTVTNFDYVEDQLMDFVSSLKDRAVKYGWIKRIPADADDQVENSLMDNHGLITLDMIRTYEESFIDIQVREKQELNCLYKCLMATFSQSHRKLL
jgi:hypothetical protein